jgi:hypothetical protein
MYGEASCIVCSRARALVALVPIARGYALKVYECSCCHSTLHLVTRVTKAALVKQKCGMPIPVEKWHDSTVAKVADRSGCRRLMN